MNPGGDDKQPNNFGAGPMTPYGNDPTNANPTLNQDGQAQLTNLENVEQNIGENPRLISDAPTPIQPAIPEDNSGFDLSSRPLNSANNPNAQQTNQFASPIPEINSPTQNDDPYQGSSFGSPFGPQTSYNQRRSGSTRQETPEFFNQAMQQNEIVIQNENVRQGEKKKKIKLIVITAIASILILGGILTTVLLLSGNKTEEEPQAKNPNISELQKSYNSFVNLIKYGKISEENIDIDESLKANDLLYFDDVIYNNNQDENKAQYIENVQQSLNKLSDEYNKYTENQDHISEDAYIYFSEYPKYVPESINSFINLKSQHKNETYEQIADNKYKRESEYNAPIITQSKNINSQKDKQLAIFLDTLSQYGCIDNSQINNECTENNSAKIKKSLSNNNKIEIAEISSSTIDNSKTLAVQEIYLIGQYILEDNKAEK